MRGTRSAQLPRGMDGLRRREDYEVPVVWRRWAAGLVDWVVTLGWALSIAILVASLLGLVGLVFGNEYSFGTNFGAGLIYFGFWIVLVVCVLRFAMNVHKIASRSETFGHRLFGLKIFALDGEQLIPTVALIWQFLGSPVLFAFCLPLAAYVLIVSTFNLCGLSCILEDSPIWVDWLLRWWIVSGLAVAWILGFINHGLMLLDKRARGWHDKLTRTEVLGQKKAGRPLKGSLEKADAVLTEQN